MGLRAVGEDVGREGYIHHQCLELPLLIASPYLPFLLIVVLFSSSFVISLLASIFGFFVTRSVSSFVEREILGRVMMLEPCVSWSPKARVMLII